MAEGEIHDWRARVLSSTAEVHVDLLILKTIGNRKGDCA